MDNYIYDKIADYQDWVHLQHPAGGAAEIERLKGGKMKNEIICSKCGKICCVDGEFPKFFAWCDTCNDYASCDMSKYAENWLATKTDEAHER